MNILKLFSSQNKHDNDEITFIAVTDNNIEGIAYEQYTKTLLIKLRDDSIYEYLGVPARIFNAFLNADSPSEFFDSFIKRRFYSLKMH